MRSHNVAYPHQVSMLADMLEDYCKVVGLAPGAEERERVAARLMALFNAGFDTRPKLRAALRGEGIRDRRSSNLKRRSRFRFQ